MSKLQKAISDLLDDVRENAVKTAEAQETPDTPKVTTVQGASLQKLAAAIRDVSLEPTYRDLEEFIGGLGR